MKFLYSLVAVVLASVSARAEVIRTADNYAEAADYAGKALMKQYELDVYFKALEHKAAYMIKVYTPINVDFAGMLLVTTHAALIEKKFEADMGPMPIRNLSCSTAWYLDREQIIIGFRYKF